MTTTANKLDLSPLPTASRRAVRDFYQFLLSQHEATSKHQQAQYNFTDLCGKLSWQENAEAARGAYAMSGNRGFVFGGNSVDSLHDRWIRRLVESALQEADDPTTEFIPHETVRLIWNEKKKSLKTRAISSL